MLKRFSLLALMVGLIALGLVVFGETAQVAGPNVLIVHCDVLADYADTRGGVVVATFGFSHYPSGGIGLDGRIMTSYSPLVPVTPYYNAPAGNIDLATADMTHPIMDGVGSFGSCYANYVSLRTGAHLVASYQNGRPLIAVNTIASGNNIVGFNTFPADYYQLPDPDFRRAFANALLYTTRRAVIEVAIDIKPGSDPNSINLKSEGVIPVAILTTRGFDATSVNGATVTFGPSSAKEVHGEGHLEDVNKDNRLDWVGHFKTQETGIKDTDKETAIKGKTEDGKSFTGKDSVNIVGGPNKAPSLNPKPMLLISWASIKSK